MGALLLLLLASWSPTGVAASPETASVRPGRPLPAPLPRTGRHCLVALGTQRDYRVAGASYDLLIVSPERPLGAALDRAKKAYPAALVLGYLNTMDVFAGAARADRELSRNESWFLHDATGQRVRVRIGKYEGERARFGMNVGEPGYQDWLVDRAVEILKAGYDGLQLDNVETDSSYHPRQVGSFISALPVELDHARWPAAQRAMLARIRSRLDAAGFADRLIVINQVRSGEPEESRQYLSEVEGANCEGWVIRDRPFDGRFGWKARVDQAAEISRTGKLLNLLALTRSMSAEEALYLYASYLLAREGDGLLFFYGTSLRPEGTRWYDIYDLNLGEPLASMEPVAGAFQRRFSRGFVAVNPFDKPATITAPEGAVDLSFDPVRRLELPPRHASILQVLEPKEAPRRLPLEAEEGIIAGQAEVIAREGASAGRVVRFGAAGASITFETTVEAGRWRLVIDGLPEGRQADACFVEAGGARRRIYFAPNHRPHIEVDLRSGKERIRVEAAEAGVAIDRLILVRLPRGRPE